MDNNPTTENSMRRKAEELLKKKYYEKFSRDPIIHCP